MNHCLSELLEKSLIIRESASPLPWAVNGSDFFVCSTGNSSTDGEDYSICMNGYKARDGAGEMDAKTDAEFIVHAANTNGALCEIVRTLLDAAEKIHRIRAISMGGGRPISPAQWAEVYDHAMARITAVTDEVVSAISRAEVMASHALK